MAALLADSNPIHWDAAAVRSVGLGDRPVNQGPTNMAYVLNMLCSWAGGYDRLERVTFRLTDNVCAGDAVRATGTVTEVRPDASGMVADCDVRLEIAGGGAALSGTATVHLPEAGRS